MGGSSDVTGVEVGQLHKVGTTVSGRSTSGHAAAKGLKEGLDSASGGLGHPIVGTALTSFVNDHVLDDSGKLGNLLTDGGHNVSNVASTARNSDEAGAANLATPISTTSEVGDRINRQV
ncbi:hypothetical protein ASC61_07925 [Aeromicrobium sp. Root344]|uniref:hypothetical protein n=1 Tax=Aeromicrobium sp. Root344 TaxID=1736521 RepID=UPI0006FF3296|nr:hypothetical protein [Aeromicrobium sp. Root344]KQV74930.1 hypothetical protein ASC61_07925 [Aeromicrobium sp. Root344]